MPYTIVHPGGLVDEPAGERELVVDVDDKLMATTTSRQVPRSDLARVCCAALFEGAAKNVAFDLASKVRWAALKNRICKYALSILPTLVGSGCQGKG